ncbi:DNA circularization N-terminal domain-containing protein [Cronobacter turicensis]|nr:DNA circularization N-terminal domain-containing protein [Cronobacter turicensis]EMA1789661.1 DNA circularization N-terminal domain-containing protein [Cronobacter turicensis]EMA1799415.1 DNA circularization N-terminal domain-containing protein [Cronobacter turicensis]EMA1847877.1 DNA circularization N-terminal domain-containing protein [Cronobacter turicensis]EMA1857186.1 DNA circularization N-terminal domain-containing protein [Cronobacter turicensis]
MSWKDNLQEASLRGVPFKVDEDEATFGRRVQVHEYPNRDKPFAEDLGRATRRFSVQAYLIGDDFFEQRNRLIEAIEKPGPCTLVHPYYGEMTVTVDDAVRVSHSGSEGRMCRVSFSFIESGELSFPTAGLATGQKLSSSVSIFDDAISSAFSAFGMDGMPDFMQDGVLNDVSGMLGTVTSAFQYVDSGISEASRLLQGDLSVLLRPPSSGMSFVNELQKMWRAGSRLSGNASDLMSMIKGLTGVTLDNGLAPRGVWKTDSKTSQSQKTQSNLVAQAVRTTAISEAAYAVTNLPQVNPAYVARRQDEQQAAMVAHPAVTDILPASGTESTAAGGVTSSTDTGTVITWDELAEVRDSLNQTIDQEMARMTDDRLFLALQTVRTDINQDISARLEQTARMAERTPVQVVPALVLAADWYDSADRAGEILARNGIRHPGFVPVKPLRVPAR